MQGRITSLECKLRHHAARHNEDIAELFTVKGQQHPAEIAMGVCRPPHFVQARIAVPRVTAHQEPYSISYNVHLNVQASIEHHESMLV